MMGNQVAVWRVTGEAATDSSGGEEVWIYCTESDLTLPDVSANIGGDYAQDRHWYRIKSVEFLGSVGPIWHADPVARALVALAMPVTLPKALRR